MNKEKKKLIAEFDHFCKCINFKHSYLDNRAIQFMNTFEKWVEGAIRQ